MQKSDLMNRICFSYCLFMFTITTEKQDGCQFLASIKLFVQCIYIYSLFYNNVHIYIFETMKYISDSQSRKH
jgi:hypothetical protein